MYLRRCLVPLVVVIAACGQRATDGASGSDSSPASAHVTASVNETADGRSSTGAPVPEIAAPPAPHDRALLDLESGLGSASVSGVRDEAELDWDLRDWLREFHMRPADLKCMVREVKASSSWHPHALSFSITARESRRFVAACGVDISKLWVESGD
jgi:hypothetical protein